MSRGVEGLIFVLCVWRGVDRVREFEKSDLDKSVERGETYPGRNTIVPKLNPIPRRQSR